MSLFGIGAHSKPQRPMGRCHSAREFGTREWFTDSSSVAPSCASQNGDAGPRINRRITDLSSSMRHGESMREAMTQEPPTVSSLRDHRVPSAQRCLRSPSPPLPSAPKKVQGDNNSEPGGMRRPLSAANLAILRGNISPRRPACLSPREVFPPAEGCAEPRTAGVTPRAQSARTPHPASVAAASLTSIGTNGASCYNPRAKPGSVADELARSMSLHNSRTGQFKDKNCADHLWREVFHTERDKQKETRLRGSSANAIGHRAKESTGIPWRHLPSYDSSGLLVETSVDDTRSTLKSYGMGGRKKKTEFSEVHALDHVQREIMRQRTESENGPSICPMGGLKKTTEFSAVHTVDHVQREIMRRRAESDLARDGWIGSNGFVDDADVTSSGATAAGSQERKKGSRILSVKTTQDSCPWQRENCNGEGAVQKPSRKKSFGDSPRGTRSRLRGSSVSINDSDCPRTAARELLASEPLQSSEPVAESRRDWDFAQDKWESRWHPDETLDLTFQSQDSSALGRCASIRNVISKSASARCFSPTTVSATTTQVHSIRARHDAGDFARPRWK